MTGLACHRFASAFGTFLESRAPVVIGRDPRASGTMIREGVIAALQATGHDVVDLGLVSTPVIQHTIRSLDAAGGISIGASHNTADWNALKFFGARGTYLSTAEAGELLDIYHLTISTSCPWNRPRFAQLDAHRGYLANSPQSTIWRPQRAECSSDVNGTFASVRRMKSASDSTLRINARLQGASSP
jgi:phosphomannomutase